jgi:hypothetical protein
MSTPPAIADVREDLKQYLLKQKFQAVMADLRKKYPVEIVGGEPAGAEPAGAGSEQPTQDVSPDEDESDQPSGEAQPEQPGNAPATDQPESAPADAQPPKK